GAVLPNTLNVYFPGHSAAALQAALAGAGFSVSAGAAATTGVPSHVLVALGFDEERARGSLRFSLGRLSDEAGVRELLDALDAVLAGQAARVPAELLR